MILLVLYGIFFLACVWALFWLIRLAVRYGVSDALRMDREHSRQTEGADGRSAQ